MYFITTLHRPPNRLRPPPPIRVKYRRGASAGSMRNVIVRERSRFPRYHRQYTSWHYGRQRRTRADNLSWTLGNASIIRIKKQFEREPGEQGSRSGGERRAVPAMSIVSRQSAGLSLPIAILCHPIISELFICKTLRAAGQVESLTMVIDGKYFGFKTLGCAVTI